VRKAQRRLAFGSRRDGATQYLWPWKPTSAAATMYFVAIASPMTSRRPAVFVATLLLCAVLPAALYIGVAASLAKPPRTGWYHAIDFHAPWQAAHSFASGHNPYVPPQALVPSGPQQSFVYPAPTAALLVPFGFLSYRVASIVFLSLSALAVALALWLLGVRDWRCYGLAFASPAVLTGISVGTFSPILLLGVAATWRWRDRPAVAACAAGLTALTKVFLWPLFAWLWFTGRRRAAAAAVAIDVVACVLAWGWISFGGAHDYPSLLQKLGSIEGRLSYAPFWHLGASSAGYVGIGAAGAVAVAYAARRARDPISFAVAILCALLATPILWLHYLTLLVAIFAVLRPRLSRLWLLSLALWASPFQGANGSPWRIAIVLAAMTCTVVALASESTSVVFRSALRLLAINLDSLPRASARSRGGSEQAAQPALASVAEGTAARRSGG
jgi:Glycosyltransferase family 87